MIGGIEIMTTVARRAGIILGLVLALLASSVALAADPAAVCAAAKRKAAAKKAYGKLKCAAKAASKGIAIDPACLAKVETKFQAAYAKAEAKGGCLTTANANDVEATVDACVAAVRAALGASGEPPPTSSCLAGKLKAAGKKLTRKAGCSAKAVTKGVPVDPACLSAAEVKFDASMTKAEAKGDCAQTGDAGATEIAVDQCLADILDEEPGPSTTTTTSASTSTSTTTTMPLTCDTESAAFAGVTAQHNSTRASATPAPNPPLDPLCWNDMLEADAQGWADNCDFSHDPALMTLGEGQNIYAGAQSMGFPPNAATDAEPLWAAEAADYDYNTNSCSSVCGHYTQIVWRSTTHFGCGIKNCTTNSPFGPGFPNWTIVVCNYKPPGNVIGQQPY
jgi:hypothetical protein